MKDCFMSRRRKIRFMFQKGAYAVTRRKIQNLAVVVGNNISRRRKGVGLTQAELAERLDIGGDSLSRIENGIVAP